ncbi:MAG: threonine--tRNA ligase, partial [Candidatus Woesearchaeota archaeon]
MIAITFPDGTVREYESGTCALDMILQDIGEGLARVAVAAKLNDEIIDLTRPITTTGTLTILTFKDVEGKQVFRHSAAHILAIAVRRLFPNAKLTIGPAIDEGFYYDIDNETPFTPEDLEKIEAEMKKITKENLKIARKEVDVDAAMEILDTNQKGNHYKIEMLKEIADLGDEQITIYDHGTDEATEFSDLCRGPHVPNTARIKAIKLTKVSGAFWRGDAKNKQLQRIYGVAFPNKDDLKEYLKNLEEAQKRDHRKIGKEQNLIMFHEYSPGAPYFLPKGTKIYTTLVDFIRSEYKKRKYDEVITPQLFNKKLWEISGHWQHYKEDMFILNVDNDEASLKPMNCPSHCLIYKRDAKSYRDLPIRIADFCMIHRNEASGALGGLLRVRKFAQDDAHIFCTPEQVEAEVLSVLEFIKYVWEEVLDFKLNYYLSTRPEKALGDKSIWDKAEAQLKSALEKADIAYEIKEGDGAFYGPKIDIDLTDALGRKWQCPTCQLDFNLPQRFELEYEGSDGKKHQ